MKIKSGSLWILLIGALLGVIGCLVWFNFASTFSRGAGKKVSCYQDSMHPWIRSDKPGKCTICGMDLTPICEGEKEFGMGDNLIVLSSNSITVLNVQTEEVKRRALNRTLRVAGTLEANETRKIIITAPASARIETLNVAYTGVEVAEGQTLLTLFSPELIQKRGFFRAGSGAAQSSGSSNLYSGSLVAPQSGTVVERPVSVGQYVTEGEKLLAIADASVLWFRFDIYERQLAWITPGQSIAVTAQALPGRTFPAVIAFIEPSIDDAARTVKVRADINNPLVTVNGKAQRLLKFGMYAEGSVRTEIPDVLAVPRTAILFPGGAAYAYVDKGDGAYERRRVVLGRQGDDLWEVLKGLQDGDRVVTSGNVLIDSQAQFNRGNTSETADADDPPAEVPAPVVMPQAAAAEQDAGPMDVVPVVRIKESAEKQTVTNMNAARVDKLKARMTLKEEMWNKRHDLIAEGRGVKSSGMSPVAAETNVAPSIPPGQDTKQINAQDSRNAVQAYRDGDKARRVISAEMKTKRNAAIAEANGQQAAKPAPLTASQRQAFQALVTESDGISRALAADDLGQFNEFFARLSVVLPPLQNELPAPHRWNDLIQRLIASSRVQPAKDLAEARKYFLPFSTDLTGLVGQLRKEDKAFAELKIYHCPMAPPPGLWMQAQGPLRNPYYGSKMLKCGEEVKQ